MLRDELMDEEYFSVKIKGLHKLINTGVKELEDGEIDKSRSAGFYSLLSSFKVSIIFCMYSRGDDIEDIRQEFISCIDLMHDVFQYSGKLFPKGFGEQQVIVTVSILSLALLLDIKGDSLSKLNSAISPLSNRSKLVNFLLSYLANSTQQNQNARQKPCEIAFKELNKISALTPEKIQEQGLIEQYLKTWYKVENRVYLYGTHESGKNNYVGYWSFESAALVKIKNIDDSSFKDKQSFYPKDLI